jgi:hypothetical protein
VSYFFVRFTGFFPVTYAGGASYIFPLFSLDIFLAPSQAYNTMQMCSITLDLIRRNNVRAISIEFSFNEEIVRFPQKCIKGNGILFNRYWWSRDLKNLPIVEFEAQVSHSYVFIFLGPFLLWKLGRELIVRNYSQ